LIPTWCFARLERPEFMMHIKRLIPLLSGLLCIVLSFASEATGAVTSGNPDVAVRNRENFAQSDSITVISPNGGENLQVGSITTVSWTS
jgi:hypothetical protein